MSADSFDMKVGDTVRLKRLTHVGDRDESAFTYGPGKGQVFVLVLLGNEPINGEGQLDRVRALRRIGWVPEPEVVELQKEAGDLRGLVDAIRRAADLPEGSDHDEIQAAIERLVVDHAG